VADVIYAKFRAGEPGGFWTAITSTLIQWAGFGHGDAWGIEAVDDDEGPAIDFWAEPFGPDTRYHFLAVWVDEVWSTPIQATVWASMVGASGEVQGVYGAGLGGDEEWGDVALALSVAILDWFELALVVASTELLDGQVRTDDDNGLRLLVYTFAINKEEAWPKLLVWSLQLPGAQGAGVVFQVFPGPVLFQPAIGPVTTTISNGSALGRIADALDVISLQDYEISINHGQAMFSVRGKVIIG